MQVFEVIPDVSNAVVANFVSGRWWLLGPGLIYIGDVAKSNHLPLKKFAE